MWVPGFLTWLLSVRNERKTRPHRVQILGYAVPAVGADRGQRRLRIPRHADQREVRGEGAVRGTARLHPAVLTQGLAAAAATRCSFGVDTHGGGLFYRR